MSELTFNTYAAVITVVITPMLLFLIFRLSKLVRGLQQDLDKASQRLLVLEARDKKAKK